MHQCCQFEIRINKKSSISFLDQFFNRKFHNNTFANTFVIKKNAFLVQRETTLGKK